MGIDRDKNMNWNEYALPNYANLCPPGCRRLVPLNVRRLTKDAYIKEMQRRTKLKQSKAPNLIRPKVRPPPITKAASLEITKNINTNVQFIRPQIIKSHSTEYLQQNGPKMHSLRPPGIRSIASITSPTNKQIKNGNQR